MAVWLFPYLIGLGAMAASLFVTFRLHVDPAVPILLFPAGAVAAVAGTILAWRGSGGREIHKE